MKEPQNEGNGEPWDFLLGGLRSLLAGGPPPAAASLDADGWAEVCRLANMHRVLPLLHRCFEKDHSALSPGAWEQLHDRYLQQAARGTAGVVELDRIVHGMELSGIAVLPLRGPLLAEWVYGDVCARQSADLDLLVRPHQAASAMKFLEGAGYAPQVRLDEGQTSAYIRFQTERAFLRNEGRAVVDLHWRPLPSYLEFSPHDDLLWARMQRVELSGRLRWMISAEDTILHLAAHGLKHGWGRLGLVVDLAMALRCWGEGALQGALKCARRTGKEKAVLTGVGLVEHFLGVGHVDTSAVTALVQRAAQRCARPDLRDDRGGQDRELMRDSLERASDRLRHVASLVAVPTGLECGMLSLPGALWLLYYPVRWGRLAWKHTVGRVKAGEG